MKTIQTQNDREVKSVSTSILSRLQDETDSLQECHRTLSRYLNALEEELDDTKQKKILEKVRSVYEQASTRSIRIDECVRAIDQGEDEYFDEST